LAPTTTYILAALVTTDFTTMELDFVLIVSISKTAPLMILTLLALAPPRMSTLVPFVTTHITQTVSDFASLVPLKLSVP
jgi:hypothetical protein